MRGVIIARFSWQRRGESSDTADVGNRADWREDGNNVQ
jgi:hypothetical protein